MVSIALQRALARLVERHAVGARADLDIVEHVEPGEERKALEHHRDVLRRSVDRSPEIVTVPASGG